MATGPGLCMAASAGDLDRCRELLTEGAEVNAADVFKRTPLINAVVSGHAPVVQLLVAARADTALADRSGWSALHWAAFQGDGDMVRLCLSLGADAKQKDLKGSTPREVVEHLLEGKGEAKFGEGLQGDRGLEAVLALLPSWPSREGSPVPK
ncbi:INVS [Symbiodinium natans]|uniref:INVS protein n=1 Tax=Symbiodinium natans TaxID=878477 RepID=A0A812T666_9DINO|nr:INVS [Symbiodinium natans]